MTLKCSKPGVFGMFIPLKSAIKQTLITPLMFQYIWDSNNSLIRYNKTYWCSIEWINIRLCIVPTSMYSFILSNSNDKNSMVWNIDSHGEGNTECLSIKKQERNTCISLLCLVLFLCLLSYSHWQKTVCIWVFCGLWTMYCVYLRIKLCFRRIGYYMISYYVRELDIRFGSNTISH